jgi:hypothetical protein
VPALQAQSPEFKSRPTKKKNKKQKIKTIKLHFHGSCEQSSTVIH